MGEPRPKLREANLAPASRAGRLAAGLVWLYQKTVSPALAVISPSCGCRFVPTCSHYASAALREHGLLAGLGLTVRRLVKCGPWHPGGLDPVPPRSAPLCFRVAVPASSVADPRDTRRNFHG